MKNTTKYVVQSIDYETKTVRLTAARSPVFTIAPSVDNPKPIRLRPGPVTVAHCQLSVLGMDMSCPLCGVKVLSGTGHACTTRSKKGGKQ